VGPGDPAQGAAGTRTASPRADARGVPAGSPAARVVRAGQDSNASGGGHEQTRLRSPNAPSIRRTGGQYLDRGSVPPG